MARPTGRPSTVVPGSEPTPKLRRAVRSPRDTCRLVPRPEHKCGRGTPYGPERAIDTLARACECRRMPTRLTPWSSTTAGLCARGSCDGRTVFHARSIVHDRATRVLEAWLMGDLEGSCRWTIGAPEMPSRQSHSLPAHGPICSAQTCTASLGVATHEPRTAPRCSVPAPGLTLALPAGSALTGA
jgi:hypothetical protein